jgi:hypothetical protein
VGLSVVSVRGVYNLRHRDKAFFLISFRHDHGKFDTPIRFMAASSPQRMKRPLSFINNE